MEDQSNHHQGLTDEYQSVTDDLESGGADKPTAIERVRAQGKRMKAESIANIDASTERVLALIEGLPDDQQQKAADFWVTIGDLFIGFWGEILTQVEQILEFVIEWLKPGLGTSEGELEFGEGNLDSNLGMAGKPRGLEPDIGD